MFSDLIYSGNKWNYYYTNLNQCILCISTKILKDYPFYICDSADYGSCRNHPEYRIKDINSLKNHINNEIL